MTDRTLCAPSGWQKSAGQLLHKQSACVDQRGGGTISTASMLSLAMPMLVLGAECQMPDTW